MTSMKCHSSLNGLHLMFISKIILSSNQLVYSHLRSQSTLTEFTHVNIRQNFCQLRAICQNFYHAVRSYSDIILNFDYAYMCGLG